MENLRKKRDGKIVRKGEGKIARERDGKIAEGWKASGRSLPRGDVRVCSASLY